VTAAAAKKDVAPSPAEQGDETKAAKKSPTFRVTAPLIAVTVGEQVLQFSAGDVLPNGIDQGSIDHLTELGFIAESE
jgi:hypothetical protein